MYSKMVMRKDDIMDWGKIFHPYTNTEEPTVDEQPVYEPMDKETAEARLGIDSDYTKADLDSRYEAVMAASVAAGESAAMQSEIAAAKAALESEFFDTDKVVATGTPAPSPVSNVDLFDTAEKHQKWWNDLLQPPSMVWMYGDAHYFATKTLKQPNSLDYPAPKRSPKPPMWYRALYSVLNFPIWRLLFIIAAFLIGNAMIDPNMNNMGDGLAIAFQWLGVIVLIVWNTALGTFTNLLRIGINWLAVQILQLQLNMQELDALREAIKKGTVKPEGGTQSIQKLEQ